MFEVRSENGIVNKKIFHAERSCETIGGGGRTPLEMPYFMKRLLLKIAS